MANGFDRRGAIVGSILFLLVMLVAAALVMPFKNPVHIRVDLPPARSAAQQ